MWKLIEEWRGNWDIGEGVGMDYLRGRWDGILDMRFVLFEEDYWRGSGMEYLRGSGMEYLRGSWDGIFERELGWSRDEILERELDGMLRYDLIGRYLELEMEMRYGWSIEGKFT